MFYQPDFTTHGLKDLELFTSEHIRMDPRTADFEPCSMDG